MDYADTVLEGSFNRFSIQFEEWMPIT